MRVSVCHCLACQRRTGRVFGAQARFPEDRVRVEGRAREYRRVSDSGEDAVFSFCSECGATVFHRAPAASALVAVPVGAFADPAFSAPWVSVWEERRHARVELPPGIERIP